MVNSTSVLGRLSFGLIAIAAAAAILLFSDLEARKDRTVSDADDAAKVWRVALVQLAPVQPVDEGVRGILAGLAARGYVDGDRLEVIQYNAQGDLAVANAIAAQVTSAGLDMIITASTPSLQTVANANRSRANPTVHIFGISSDPYGAGVGISREDHLDHPPYMAGLGSLPPVRELFDLVRTINPAARRVGLVWNPTEANSEAATHLARAAAAEFGMELVEGNAESSTAASEVAQSVISRGIDVLWVSPDSTVYTAIDALIEAARRGGVPVVTSLPGSVGRGSLLDLGARYEDIGYVQGLLAADVLEGRDPASVPVENWIPVDLHLNLTVLDGISRSWRIGPDLVASASVVIDDSGTRERGLPKPEPPEWLRWDRLAEGGQVPNVDLVMYSESPVAEQSIEGVRLGLAQGGFDPDLRLNLRVHSAQGDMPTLVSIIDAIRPTSTELIMTLSTPALQNALQRVRGIPIVFGMVSNPFIVGAGISDTDHVPTATGAYLNQPLESALDIVAELFPEARTLGTLFTPAEVNSQYNRDRLLEVAKARGYSVENIGIATAADVLDASIALAATRPDVWVQVVDNLISSSYPAVMEAADREGIPVITFSVTAAEFGPLVIVGRDYFDAGVEAGRLAARVLRGESVAALPFRPASTTRYILNHEAARRFGVRFSDELIGLANAQGH
jgi:ABC-type uncharacterized transport system substrate-binding protein